MSRSQVWKVVASIIVIVAIIWKLTKVLLILWRVSFPAKTTPPPDYIYIDVTIPSFDLKDDWFAPVFDNHPHLNISDKDLQHDFELLNKYQNSNSDDDFWNLIRTLQKQKVHSISSQPKTEYIGTKPENSTHSNNTVPSQDLAPLNNLIQFNTSARSMNATRGSHDSLWLKSPTSSDYPVPSNKPPYLDEPAVLSLNHTIKSENPLHSNDTAQSNTATKSNNSTWLFHKLLPAS